MTPLDLLAALREEIDGYAPWIEARFHAVAQAKRERIEKILEKLEDMFKEKWHE